MKSEDLLLRETLYAAITYGFLLPLARQKQ
jgi:hypothetical protein